MTKHIEVIIFIRKISSVKNKKKIENFYQLIKNIPSIRSEIGAKLLKLCIKAFCQKNQGSVTKKLLSVAIDENQGTVVLVVFQIEL